MADQQEPLPKWERVAKGFYDDHEETFRLKVPNGWLYRVVDPHRGAVMTFVPDPSAEE